MNVFPPLYKRDVTGRVRVWHMEVDGDRYRSVSGLTDGEKVETNWTVAVGKNQGRSNETTPEQQAVSEVESEYRKKRDLGYFDRIEDIDNEKYFAPMLAQKFEPEKLTQVHFDAGVFAQPKLDGIRCIATARGLWSRKGKPILAVPHIHELLKPLFELYPDLVLDGELYNHELKDDFNKIVSMVKKQKPSTSDLELSRELVQYHTYDIPVDPLNGDSVDFFNRISTLNIFVSEMHDPGNHIQLVETHVVEEFERLDELYQEWIERGYEGQMIRHNAPYEQKRSKNLLKRKEFLDAEFEIVRIEEGLGNWSGFAKRVVCRLPDGREFGSGLKGNQEYAKQILDNAKLYEGKQATIRYFAETPDGIPRFPIAVALHDTERL